MTLPLDHPMAERLISCTPTALTVDEGGHRWSGTLDQWTMRRGDIGVEVEWRRLDNT